MLTETLRRLEFNGLTPLGETLLEPIGAPGEWAFAHGGEVTAARPDRAGHPRRIDRNPLVRK
ncbi:hypothetical protein GCM10027199_52810 [Amycolatopsis magusensis]